MILRLTIFTSLITICSSSFCGEGAIPYTFQSLHSGHPVLGCARPKCFGWNADGSRVEDTSMFYKINKKVDGFLRQDQLVRPATALQDLQTSVCSERYKTVGCEEREWVGGISPMINPQKNELQVRCCAYEGLDNTEDRGVAGIQNSQIFIGGEVFEDNQLVGFDYISNIKKTVFDNGTIEYAVSVRRMACSDGSDQKEAIISQNADITSENTIEVVPKETPSSSIPPVLVQQQQQTASVQQPYGQALSQTYGFPLGFRGLDQTAYQPQYYPQSLNSAGYPIQSNGVVQQQVQQGVAQVQGSAVPSSPLAPIAAPQPPQFNGYQAQAQYGQQQQQSPYGVQAQSSNPASPYGLQTPQPMMGMMTLPTMAPIQLPKLEDIPKIEIPSVEDVENVIPPMHRAILTNIAKFFGVL